MQRIALFGIIGCAAAVALIAHLWMFPSYDVASTSPHAHVTAAAAPTVDMPLTASCASKMSACVATDAEEQRLPLGIAISPLPAMLLTPRRRPSAACRRTWPTRHGPGPPLSPIEEGVLLLE
jgi:hypothetical protein